MAEQVFGALSILRRREFEGCTGLKTSSLYAEMARGEFPRPVQISAKAVGWRRQDVMRWLETRPLAGVPEAQGSGQ